MSSKRTARRAAADAGPDVVVLPQAASLDLPLRIAHLLPRPVAWVLGGGGSYGATQMGMVRALAETDLRPDLVVGTSVGSLNGAVIAGDPVNGSEKLAELWPQIERRDVFPGNVLTQALAIRSGRSHMFDSGPLADLIAAQIPAAQIEDLELPFVAVAADLDTGERVALDTGDLRSALLASTAIPGVYPWVERDGRRLVDGGLVANVPIELAYERGARSVVVLDCGLFTMSGRWADGVISVVVQALTIAGRQQVVRDLQVAEEIPVVYLPAPSNVATTILDFTHTSVLADGAYTETSTMLAALALHRAPLVSGIYGSPPLKADHPAVEPLIRW